MVHPNNEILFSVKKKSRVKINWLKSAAKQPSIISKFCSLGKITTNQESKGQSKENEYDLEEDLGKYENDNTANGLEVGYDINSGISND